MQDWHIIIVHAKTLSSKQIGFDLEATRKKVSNKWPTSDTLARVTTLALTLAHKNNQIVENQCNVISALSNLYHLHYVIRENNAFCTRVTEMHLRGLNHPTKEVKLFLTKKKTRLGETDMLFLWWSLSSWPADYNMHKFYLVQGQESSEHEITSPRK